MEDYADVRKPERTCGKKRRGITVVEKRSLRLIPFFFAVRSQPVLTIAILYTRPGLQGRPIVRRCAKYSSSVASAIFVTEKSLP